ncbi:MAG: exo-alpha-sialidase [Pirellulales bacterium]
MIICDSTETSATPIPVVRPRHFMLTFVVGACLSLTTAEVRAQPEPKSHQAAASPKQDGPARRRRILYNFDGDSCMWTRAGGKGPIAITVDDVKTLVEEIAYEGGQVDTMLVCINAQVMYYPTKVGTMRGALSAPEQRAQWPASELQRFENMKRFFSAGIDPYAVMLSEAKRRGLEALLTFRMNDAHGNDFLRTQFWMDHPEYRLKGGSLDFVHDEVRDYVFRLIEEAVWRYHCDGIELDFNRFPTFFKDGTTAQRVAKMNSLVQRVRNMLDEVGNQRGRRLVLAVRIPSNYGRTPPNPASSREVGCDLVAWVKSGWIDFVTVSEFLHARYDLPIKPWKEAIRDVPVYGGIECTEGGSKDKYLTPEKYCLAAHNRWRDGADGVYLFNFFTTREYGTEAWEPPFEVLRKLGDRAALLQDDVQHNSIAVEARKSLPFDSLSCEQIAIGEPDDYKPCIIQLPDGELLLSCFHQHRRAGNKVMEQTLLFRSKDGGQTWAGPEILDLLGREPYLTVLSDGTIFVTGHLLASDVRNQWGYTTGFLHRSIDRGHTWQTIRVESEGIKAKASNHTTRNVLEMSDGTLLVGVDYDGGDGPYFVWRSGDSGKTWDKTQKCEPKNFQSVYGFFGGETWLWQARSGKVWAFVRVDSNELPIAGRPIKAGDDQSDHFILFSSIDKGHTFERIRDFGDYGEMYMSLLRLRDSRLLLTFTVRDLKPPLGVRALLGKETGDGFEFDWKDDRLMVDAKTPVGKDQGGGFGPTIQLADGTLVTSYSYRGQDEKTHVEVVRWRLPLQ